MRKCLVIVGFLAALGLLLTGCPGAANQAPTVEITTPEDQAQLMSKKVNFVAKGGDEDLPAGKKLKYSWDFGDGTQRETETPKVDHTYKEPGTYTVKVVTVDDKGAKSEAAQITITVKNAPPQAEAQATLTRGQAPLTVEFDAGASNDPDGNITKYEWDFGDGTKGSGQKVRHEYAQAGSYIVTLTVTDDNGATVTATLTITVEAATPQAKLWEVRLILTPDGRFVSEPDVLKINPGDTIRWVCVSGCPHTATAYSEENGKVQGIPEGAPSWDSGLMMQDDQFEFTFPADAPLGSYPYYCAVHEMIGHVGLIVVGEFTELSEEFLNSLPELAKAEMERLIEEAKELE